MKRGWTGLAATLCRPRWLAVIVGLCAAAAAAGYGSWSYLNAEGHRRQARQALDDRNFEAAKTDLNAYLAVRPNDAEGHFLLARACRRARVEDLDRAHKNLDEARRLGWPALDLALESAMLDVQEHGVSRDRETSLRSYLDSRGPDDGLVLEALTRGCLLDNRLGDAKAWLNAWVDRAPDDWYGRLWRGAMFEYLSEPNYAIADFEFVLKKRPADEEVRKRLGLMLAQSGYNYEEALKYLEPYRRNHPDDADVLVGIARCRRALGQSEAAEAPLRQALADHPDHVDALLTLALTESDRGDDLEALKELRRLAQLARQGREAEGLERLRRLEPTPNHMDVLQRQRTVLNMTAGVLGLLGRDEEARRCRVEAERINKGREELPAALRECKERPRDVAALDKLGAIYLRVGMEEEARDCLERALRVKPDDPLAHRGLAEYYGGRQDPESRRQAERHRRLAGTVSPDAAPPISTAPQGP